MPSLTRTSRTFGERTVIHGFPDEDLRDLCIEHNPSVGCRVARLPGFFSGYRVTETGHVLKKWGWEPLKIEKRRPRVSLVAWCNQLQETEEIKVVVPHLVLSVFVGLRPSLNHECHHGPHGPKCHAVWNLKWVTPSEHYEHHWR